MEGKLHKNCCYSLRGMPIAQLSASSATRPTNTFPDALERHLRRRRPPRPPAGLNDVGHVDAVQVALLGQALPDGRDFVVGGAAAEAVLPQQILQGPGETDVVSSVLRVGVGGDPAFTPADRGIG